LREKVRLRGHGNEDSTSKLDAPIHTPAFPLILMERASRRTPVTA